MNKEFTLYNEALVLKELGFDEPCLAVHYEHKCYLYSKSRGVKNSNKTTQLWICTAPTYSQAFRWFKDKFKLKGDIIHADSNGSDKFEIWRWNFDNNIGKWERLSYFGTYNSREEAELACLRKLIEIVKNK